MQKAWDGINALMIDWCRVVRPSEGFDISEDAKRPQMPTTPHTQTSPVSVLETRMLRDASPQKEQKAGPFDNSVL